MDECCNIDEKLYSRLFKAFGDKSRLRIIALLANNELTVNEIAEKIGLSQPTISRHLGILKDADLVHDRRDKQRIYYSLNKDSVQACCIGFCDCLEIQGVSEKEDEK
jgi:DNA-binding transcriptional ArsR family regulator